MVKLISNSLLRSFNMTFTFSLKTLTVSIFFGVSLSYSLYAPSTIALGMNSNTVNKEKVNEQAQHNQWLKEKFSLQHEKLIPIVAVADMFSACNKVRKVDPIGYQLKDLVLKMPKAQLAEKLSLCLGDDSMKSDQALNFGLMGCFSDQLSSLPKIERQQKMKLVVQAISSLSRQERQKSFTNCVTKQAIHFLK